MFFPPVTCPDTNPYTANSQSEVVEQLYADYKDTSISIEEARQIAFWQLGIDTQHKSHFIDIVNSNAQMIRITITYIDSALIQDIVLNDTLSAKAPISTSAFKEQLNHVMSNFAARNELLFVVTIVSPTYKEPLNNGDSLTVEFPINEMVLTNSANGKVSPKQGFLFGRDEIDIVQGPVSGIVSYPLTVTDQGKCSSNSDQWNTIIVLSIPSITFGDEQVSSQTWFIKHRPLITTNFDYVPPSFSPDFDWSRITKISEPPRPDWKPLGIFEDDPNWDVYWEDMGRYIWYLLINI